MPLLRQIFLAETNFTDISTITYLSSLETLDLEYTGITDFSPLRNFTQLKTLMLKYTSIDDVTLLSDLTTLTSINLMYTPVVDVTPLSGLTNLMKLHSDKDVDIYLDTSQLPSGGGAVSEWNSFATVEVGGAGLPTLETDEPNRYVRFGTTDATNSKGNYLNLGTQTWNLQNGFTFVGVVRLYENKTFQRIFDLGNAGSYSCLDVREMAFYDRSLTDSELSDVVGHLHYKYFSDPLFRKAPTIHLDTSQLPQLSLDNTNVSSWNSFATAEVGGAGLPKLRTNEPNRYVRFGTTDATNLKGNYLNLGTQTWNLQNGFTYVGVVRFYESKAWQRISDFGDSSNILTTMDFGPGSWMVIVMRVTNANLLETWKDPSSNLIDKKVTGTGTITSYAARTLTNNWIGRSNWAGDSYACLDVREMAFYDRAISDSELSDVVSYMRIKHFGDSIPTLGPLSIKSILDFVDPGWSSGENPYAMDKLFRGSRTPKYISAINRIPLAASEPARISFDDFRRAGLTENPRT
eukprot:gene6316-2939_t